MWSREHFTWFHPCQWVESGKHLNLSYINLNFYFKSSNSYQVCNSDCAYWFCTNIFCLLPILVYFDSSSYFHILQKLSDFNTAIAPTTILLYHLCFSLTDAGFLPDCISATPTQHFVPCQGPKHPLSPLPGVLGLDV